MCRRIVNVARAGVSLRRLEGVVAVRIMTAYALALGTLASSAQAADVDWKLYGSASVTGTSFCFYDAHSAARTSSGYIRVWTKCLAQKDLESADKNDDVSRKIVESAARKITEGYVPPIVVIGKMDFAQIPEISAYEEIANLNSIGPRARFFEELNCSERMDRRLSTYLIINGESRQKDTPSDWEYVPPEGNVATLLKILCRLP